MGSARATTTISSPAALRALAVRLATKLRPGDAIGLVGELGAGKTVFAAALARALGVRTRVASPTFIVVAEHRARTRRIARLYHFDLYRLPNVSGHDAALLKDALADPRGAVLIEWADRAKPILARAGRGRVTYVHINITGLLTRRCVVTGRLSRFVPTEERQRRGERFARAGQRTNG